MKIPVGRIASVCLAALIVMLGIQALQFAAAQTRGRGPLDLRSALAAPTDAPATETAAAVGASPGDKRPLIPDKNLWDIVQSGGVLMAPILFCSVVMLIFVFERAICLRRGNILPRHFAKRFLLQLEEGQLTQTAALRRCEENGSPLALVFEAAVRKWGRSSVEVEQAMIDAGERVSNTLRRNLRVLNGVATVSPLLGLLGTVVGMIQAFNTIASSQAMGHPELLADGISQALLTTAAGMTVAIPALIFSLYFLSCADRRIIEIDALGQQVVQLIAEDGTAKVKGRAAKSRSGKKVA